MSWVARNSRNVLCPRSLGQESKMVELAGLYSLKGSRDGIFHTHCWLLESQASLLFLGLQLHLSHFYHHPHIPSVCAYFQACISSLHLLISQKDVVTLALPQCDLVLTNHLGNNLLHKCGHILRY